MRVCTEAAHTGTPHSEPQQRPNTHAHTQGSAATDTANVRLIAPSLHVYKQHSLCDRCTAAGRTMVHIRPGSNNSCTHTAKHTQRATTPRNQLTCSLTHGDDTYAPHNPPPAPHTELTACLPHSKRTSVTTIPRSPTYRSVLPFSSTHHAAAQLIACTQSTRTLASSPSSLLPQPCLVSPPVTAADRCHLLKPLFSALG